MSNKLDNIVVLGGGTAGWMTALMVKTRIPSAKVTVIESAEVGILGAGEGTTPMFLNFLQYVGISLEDVIKNTKATFKNGLKFTNWDVNNDYYYHEFAPRIDTLNSNKRFHSLQNFGKHQIFYWLNLFNGIPKSKFDFMSMVTDYGNVPFIHAPGRNFETSVLDEYEMIGNIGVHFNASLMATFLKKVAIERGIVWVEGKVVDVLSKDNGDIKSLVLESSDVIPLDFVFDCSGLHRLLVGNHYKTEWVSSSDFLQCDSALPFFTPTDEKLPPYTECIAMKYGWMWRIPLQDRYGCGYVFDSKHITEEEAAKEIETYLGFEPTYPRKNKGAFKFDPGYYKETWVNNCIAIGLSSGFMEPLEATNIGVALINLSDSLSDLSVLTRRSDSDKKYFNDQVFKLNSEIAEFLYVHYITQKTDTKFWEQFKDLEKAPKGVQPILKSLNTSMPSVVPFSKWDAFNYMSFYQIVGGNGILNQEIVKEAVIGNSLTEAVTADFYEFRRFLNQEAKNCVPHKTMIFQLGGKYEEKK